MNRCLPVVLVVALLSLLIAGQAVAQVKIPGYVVSDLQLISQESKPEWSAAWTGPIQAATILAWLADHGYPAFIHDFNNDGVIDELDTIELASLLGQTFMETETTRGTTDVQLVTGLAHYVAQYYPDQFELKIYDIGFVAEFAAQQGEAFDPNYVSGISLVLMEDPTITSYEVELESGEGVILGLAEQGENTYLSGRSFLYETTTEGFTPIDLAWSAEDRWEPEHQGKVLETVGKMDPHFYLDYRADWTLVELMLALSPVTDPPAASEPLPCPEDAIAYDVMITDLEYGSVQVEECVTRDGAVDTYAYTVTNIDFTYAGCGLCLFAVPRPPALTALGHIENAPWLFSELAPMWTWRLPMGSCGLLPGESTEFTISVPGPTTDITVIGSVGSCIGDGANGGAQVKYRTFAVQTTGPGPGCPDLVIQFLDQSCLCDSGCGICTLTVWANVLNIGTAPVNDPIEIVLRSLDHPANVGDAYAPPPALAPGDAWPVTLVMTFPMIDPLCPTGYELVVDPEFLPGGFVAECDETNNNYIGSIDCSCEQSGACCFPDGSCANLTESQCADQGGDYHAAVDCSIVQCPPPTQLCPDLVVEITMLLCRNVGHTAPYYEVTIEAEVTNIGTQMVTDAIRVKMTTACGSDTDIIHTDLAPGDTATADFSLDCSANYGGCHDVTVEVDYLNFIVECEEGNNEDTAEICCQ